MIRSQALIVLLSLLVSSVQARNCHISTSQAQKVFGLNDIFNQVITLRPFDEGTSFPWWVLSSENQVLAVIETIKLDDKEVPSNIVLDAQYLGGNDLKIAVPAGSINLNCQN